MKGGEAERRLAELQAALDAKRPDPQALDLAAQRVAAALACLSRATPPDELARVADLHACVRETTRRRRDEAGAALERSQSDRARHARLTRPSDGGPNVDVRA